MHLPDMVTKNGPAVGAHIIQHRTNELHVKQRTVPIGQATSSIKEVTKTTKSLACLSSFVFVVCRSGHGVSWDFQTYHGVSAHVICFTKNCTCLGFWKRFVILAKSIAVLFEMLTAVLQS